MNLAQGCVIYWYDILLVLASPVPAVFWLNTKPSMSSMSSNVPQSFWVIFVSPICTMLRVNDPVKGTNVDLLDLLEPTLTPVHTTTLLTPVHSENDSRVSYCLIVLTTDYCTCRLAAPYKLTDWLDSSPGQHDYVTNNRRYQVLPLVCNSRRVLAVGIYRWAKFGWNLGCSLVLFSVQHSIVT